MMQEVNIRRAAAVERQRHRQADALTDPLHGGLVVQGASFGRPYRTNSFLELTQLQTSGFARMVQWQGDPDTSIDSCKPARRSFLHAARMLQQKAAVGGGANPRANSHLCRGPHTPPPLP